jgi:quinol monooxygenase YgiN
MISPRIRPIITRGTTMQDQKVALTAEITILQGFEEQVLSAARKCVVETHKEPGCVHYILSQRKEQPLQIMFFEVFASKEAFDFHCNAPHTKTFIEGLKGKVEGDGPRLTFLNLL